MYSFIVIRKWSMDESRVRMAGLAMRYSEKMGGTWSKRKKIHTLLLIITLDQSYGLSVADPVALSS